MELLKQLLYVLSVIITMSFVSTIIYEKFHTKPKLNHFIQAIIFIIISAYSILNPIVLSNNFFFDGRSVIISISTLFFGWATGLVVTIASLFFRALRGDMVIHTTFLITFLPFFVAFVFDYLVKKRKAKITAISLFAMGFTISFLIFLILFFEDFLPKQELISTQIVASIIYPLFITLNGLVIHSGISRVELINSVRESESKWKHTIQSISEGILIVDLFGKILSFNNQIKNLFDIYENKIKDIAFNDVFTLREFDSGNRFSLYFGLENYFEKKVFISCNDIEIPAEIYINKISNESNNSSGYVLVLRDIRKDLESQAKLIESEKTFRGMFNSLQEAIYIHDLNGKLIDVNYGAVKMYGYEKEEFIGKTPMFLSAEGKNDHLNLPEIWEKSFNGETQIFEFWGKRKDGTIFPKIVSIYPGEYFGQKVLIAVALDITSLKLAQEKIIEQEKLLRTLLNANPDIIYVKDKLGKWIEVNKGMLEILNLSDVDVLGMTNDQLLAKVDKSSKNVIMKFEKIEEETKNRDSFLRIEEEIKLSDTDIRYYDIIGVQIFDENKDIKNILFIGRDISYRKKEELEKQIILNNFSTVIENFDGGILLESGFRKIELVNDNLIKLFRLRYSKSHITSNNFEYFIGVVKEALSNPEHFITSINESIKSETSVSNFEVMTLDNRIIEINYLPIVYENQLVNHLWIFRDVTKSRTIEKKLKSQIFELERLNKSMVERELRMINLKEEVNELLAKAGLPPKYNIVK